MLTIKETLHNLQPWQIEVLVSKAKVKVLLNGRQSGKSTVLRALIYKNALEEPNKELLIVAKTHGQVKEVHWRHMVAGNDPIFPKELIVARNNQDLFIELINGTRISFSGSENADALLGRTIDYLYLDEWQSQSPDVWRILQPMIAARNGYVTFAGTAKGFDDLYDKWWAGWKGNPNRLPTWRSWKIKTAESGTPAGSPQAIEEAKRSLTKQQFEQEYEASPYAVQGVIYSNYDYDLNKSDKELDRTMPIHIGMDFNINPMVAVIGQRYIKMENNRRIDEFHIIEEVYQESFDTHKMAAHLKSRFHNWAGRTIVYPDPAGSQHRTSAAYNSTDHTILRDSGFTLLFRPAHPAVQDRINSVQAMFQNAANERRLFIHPRCTNLIKCLKGQVYKNGTPDKSSGLDHMNDALGYLIEYMYPISGAKMSTSNMYGYN